MGGCIAIAIIKAAQRRNDTPAERQRKEAALPVALSLPVLLGAAGLLGAGTPGVQTIGNAWGALSGVGVVAWTLVTRRLPLALVEVAVVLGVLICLVLIDWGQVSRANARAWPFAVLFLDGLLVCDARPNTAHAVIALVLIWLAVQGAEAAARAGLYESAWFAEAPAVWLCECAAPPCGARIDTAAMDWAGAAFVFVTDYQLTRGFAGGMREREAMLVASVEAAERAGEHLAVYDTEAAQELLDDRFGSQMPAGLHHAFLQIVGNLDAYRPYLPQSVLHRGRESLQGSRDTQSDTCSSNMSSNSTVSSDRVMSSSGSSDVRSQSPAIAVIAARQRRSLTNENTCSDVSTISAGSREQTDAAGSNLPRSASVRSPRCASTDAARSGQRSPRSSSPVTSCNTGRASRRRVTSAAIAVEPSWKVVSLMATNRDGFLASGFGGENSCRALLAWFDAEVGRALDVVSARGRGVLDLLSGDHLFCSFGAARPCPQHKVAAARSALLLGGGYSAPPATPRSPRSPRNAAAGKDWTSAAGPAASLAALPTRAAACAGPAICGDFGSGACKRFMTVGGVSSSAAAVERVATLRRVGALIDDIVYGSAQTTMDCRAAERVRFPKRGAPAVFLLWQVDTEKREAEDQNQEWMYVMSSGENRWDEYNAIVTLWACGRRMGNVRRMGGLDCLEGMAAAAVAGAEDPEVRAAAAALSRRIAAAVVPGAPPTMPAVVAEMRELRPADAARDAPAAALVDGSAAVQQLIRGATKEREALRAASDADRRRQQAAVGEKVRARKEQRQPGSPRAAAGYVSPKATPHMEMLDVFDMADMQPSPVPKNVQQLQRQNTCIIRKELSEKIGIELTRDGALLVLDGVDDGSAAERAGMRDFVGRRVTHINDAPVQKPADVVLAFQAARREIPLGARGVQELAFRFAEMVQQRRQQRRPDSSERIVTLSRKRYETWVRWGVKCDKGLRLWPAAKGSIAAQSKELAECEGMRLVKVNGREVSSAEEARYLTEDDATEIEFRFVDVDMREPVEDSPARSKAGSRTNSEASSKGSSQGTPHSTPREECSRCRGPLSRPGDALRAPGMHTGMLCLLCSEITQVRANPAITVVLRRDGSDTWLPWGLRFNELYLILKGISPGSIAENSPEAVACRGMKIASINGTDVTMFSDVERLTQNVKQIRLKFVTAEV